MPKALSPAQIEHFRDRLIQTAEKLFAKHGLDGVSMRQIAASLGVSPMMLYSYFKGKEDILAAVRASCFDRIAAVFEDLCDTNVDAATASLKAGRVYREHALKHADAYRLMFDMAQPHETDYPDLQRAVARSRKALGRFPYRLIDEDVLQGDPDILSYAMWSLSHGLIALELAGKIRPDIDLDQLWRSAHQALYTGFGGKLETAETPAPAAESSAPKKPQKRNLKT